MNLLNHLVYDKNKLSKKQSNFFEFYWYWGLWKWNISDIYTVCKLSGYRVFWSMFSQIWTEYSVLPYKSSYSEQVRENTNQKNINSSTWYVAVARGGVEIFDIYVRSNLFAIEYKYYNLWPEYMVEKIIILTSLQ